MNISEKEIEERVERCLKILKEDPDSQIFAALSDCYRKTGDFKEAARICSEGLQKHPEYGSGHLVMAKINMGIGDYDRVLESLKLAKKYMGQTQAIELLECETLFRLGKTNEAKKLYSQLKVVDPGNPSVMSLTKLLNDSQNQVSDGVGMGEEASLRKIPAKKEDTDADNKEDKKISVDLLVQILGSFSEVQHVLAASYDGEIISTFPRDGDDFDIILQFCNVVSHGLNHCLPSVDMGAMNGCLVETANRKIYLRDTGKFYLMFEAGIKMNLGLISLKLSEMLPGIEYQG